MPNTASSCPFTPHKPSENAVPDAWVVCDGRVFMDKAYYDQALAERVRLFRNDDAQVLPLYLISKELGCPQAPSPMSTH